MPQQLLEREGIAAAVHQILAGKSMPKKVCACLGNTSALVVARDSLTQRVVCKLLTALIAEKEIIRCTATNKLILPQDLYHLTAKRDYLNLPVLVMPCQDLPLFQVYIAIPDSTNRSSTTARVQQEVDNYPSSID